MPESLIDRPNYLEQLIRLRDKQLIKVVTGIRRCGKSTLFDLYCNYLLVQGVKAEQIIRINLEDPDYNDINDAMKLYHWIKNRLINDQVNYILIDEVQIVPDFQRAVDGLFIKKNCDVYITGSNAQLLSGELATYLSGRYIEIKMLPLSFSEFVAGLGDPTDLVIKFQRYMQYGSFPYVLQLERPQDIAAYLEGVYTSVIVKDIAIRKNLTDVTQLDSIIRFMAENIGNLCSSTKIADTMTSVGRKISVHTVESYLSYLIDSFVLHKVGRYDVKGKQLLTTGHKYYLADPGLRYYLLGSKNTDVGRVLENIIYLELIRRGYTVHIGKVGTAEVDFIAVGPEGEAYYQVAYTVMDTDGKTLERELASLKSIRDHNPKYLITMDFTPPVSHQGIRQLNALEWLLQ